MVLEGKDAAFANIDFEVMPKLEQAGSALYVALQPTINRAIEQCPKHTGTLAGSGRIDPPQTEGNMTFCTIGFHTAYALRIHEDLNIQHPIHIDPKTGKERDCTGNAKYLEIPLREDLDIIPARIKQALESIS
jgi:hypothetical protein